MKSISSKELITTAMDAAGKAGDVIVKNLGKISKNDIHTKQASDFVTKVDRESEETIIRTIKRRFPGHGFLAEESAGDRAKGKDRRLVPSNPYLWIIDPLDGTTNFIHEFPVFCVSIALQVKRHIALGVVYDPTRNEMFTAERGKGAVLNGKNIKISSGRDIKTSLVATGFPFRQKHVIDKYLELFRKILDRVSDLRRAGAAAIDLAYLAAGRCDGFFEIGLKTWDMAAGSLLVEEAGGVVTDFSGGEDYLETGNIIAGTPKVHKEILKEAKTVFKGVIEK